MVARRWRFLRETMQAKEPAADSLRPEATWIQRGPLVAGVVALITLALVIFTPGSLLDKLFIINSGVCAQRLAHSYFFDGQQLPLEARMIGIFGAFSLTLLFLWFIGRGRTLRLPPLKITLVLVALIVPVAVDGLNATLYDMGWFHLYEPQLVLRIITGTLSGIGIAALVQPFFNLLVWRYAYPGGPLQRWRELGFALLIGVGLILATMSGWGPLFWPITFLAVGGVFTMLVILNLMIALSLSGKQNWAQKPADLLTPAALMFLFTLVEMGAFAAVRISLIGSPI